MGMTVNETAFAAHYMNAAASLMDAIANPKRDTFVEARSQAIDALRAAFTPAGENAGCGSEEWLAHQIKNNIIQAARWHGYPIDNPENQ